MLLGVTTRAAYAAVSCKLLSTVSRSAVLCAAFALVPDAAFAQSVPDTPTTPPEGSAAPTSQNQPTDIVITGIRAAITKGLETKRKAKSIVDSISAEDIGKLPDNNIAEAVQRIPGVSIDRSGGEGRHISINGLGPDFSLTLLNGRQIASSDSSRSFSFDTIAANLVRRLDVYKSINPNIPEGGLGGTIDVRTARPFDFDGFTASGQVSYLYSQTSKDGFPQGSFLVSDRFMDGRLGILLSFTHQKRHTTIYGTDAGAWSKNYFVDPVTTQYVEDTRDNAWRSWDIQYGKTEDRRERNGGTAAIQFQPTESLILTADYLYSKFKVRTTTDSGGAYLWAVQDSPDTILDEHGLHQLDIGRQPGVVTPVTSVPGYPGATVIPSACVYPFDGVTSSYDEATNTWTEGHDCLSSYSWNHSSSVRPTTTQLAGFNTEWKPAHNFTAVADAYWSQAINDNKGLNTGNTFEMGHLPGYLVIFPKDGSAPSFDLKGFDLANAADELRVRLLGNSGTYTKAVNKGLTADFDYAPRDFLHIRFGGSYGVQTKRNRFYSTPRAVQALYWCCSIDAPPDLGQVLNGVIFADSKFGVTGDPYPIFLINEAGLRAWAADEQNLINHRTCPATSPTQCGYKDFVTNGRTFNAVPTTASYRVEEKDLGLYGMLDANFHIGGAPTNLVAGLRYSRTHLISSGQNRTVIGFDGNSDKQLNPVYEGETPGGPRVFSPISVENTYQYFLPSANLKVELTPRVIARLAASKTMTRPTLDDISPALTLSGFGFTPKARSGRGRNPLLKPFTSKNLDASFEYYYSRRGAIAVAGFWKQAKNFIVTTTEPETIDSITFIRNVRNVDGSPSNLTLSDVQQFQITRPHNAASATIKGITASWTHTFDFGLGFQANYTKVWSSTKTTTGGSFSVPGISDTANLVAFYEKGPISARIAYNWRSSFVESPGDDFSLPVNGSPYHQIDARLGYDIGRGIDLGVEVTNLTNEKVLYHAQFDDQFVRRTSYGRQFTATLSKKF